MDRARQNVWKKEISRRKNEYWERYSLKITGPTSLLWLFREREGLCFLLEIFFEGCCGCSNSFRVKFPWAQVHSKGSSHLQARLIGWDFFFVCVCWWCCCVLVGWVFFVWVFFFFSLATSQYLRETINTLKENRKWERTGNEFCRKKQSWLYLKIGILYDLLLYEAKAYAAW